MPSRSTILVGWCYHSITGRVKERRFNGNMALGTKHRLKEAADLCKQQLREKHADQRVLVEEFIAELEGKERDHTRWSAQFADQRQVDAEMVERVDAAFEKWLSGA